jgi:hypothetical protein
VFEYEKDFPGSEVRGSRRARSTISFGVRFCFFSRENSGSCVKLKIPLVCARRCRTVTFASAGNSGRCFVTGSSRASFPSVTSASTVAATWVFVTLPTR